MQFRYPRSFLKLLTVGFLLAVLPLIVGLLASTLTIQQLSVQSQRAVFDAARIAHASRQLSEKIPALERAARQSVILGDAALQRGYLRLRESFALSIHTLRDMPLDAEMRTLLDQLEAHEADTHARQLRGRQQAAALAGAFDVLATSGNQVLSHANAMIDREAEALRERAAEAHTNAWLQLAIMVPVALLVVAGFAYLLARPIAQIEAGIHALGEQKLDAPVVVEGPEDLVKLGVELDWLRQRLAALEAQKSQFMRHVSHELKTPLTALREGSDLLAEGIGGALNPRQQEIVSIVRENSLHLQRLIEDLLRHGEAEFRARQTQFGNIDLASLVAQVAKRQQVAMDAASLTLRAQLDVPVFQSDSERLRVILDNLLSNAIKHAPAGSEITVTAQQSAGLLELRVIDQGPGVPASDRERVLEPFYRGADQPRGKVGSTGLGLSIVLDHVRALGGSIAVGTGRGDFLVKLPVLEEKADGCD